MARPSVTTSRLEVQFADQSRDLMKSLVSAGIFGATEAEVCRALTNQRLEQLIKDGFLKIPSAKTAKKKSKKRK